MGAFLVFAVVALLAVLGVITVVYWGHAPTPSPEPLPPPSGRPARLVIGLLTRMLGYDTAAEAQAAMAESPARRRSLLAASLVVIVALTFGVIQSAAEIVLWLWRFAHAPTQRAHDLADPYLIGVAAVVALLLLAARWRNARTESRR